MKRTMKKTLAAGAALMLAGSALVSCGSDSGSGGDGAGLIRTDGTEPQHPLLTTNTNENGGGRILDQLYVGLVRYTDDGKVENAVAESITPNKDATEFTFKLKDWKFSNGEKVTADSFINAWNYGAAAKNAQLLADFFEPIKGFEEVAGKDAKADKLSGLQKISDKEFKVTLSAPAADFPDRLGATAYMPLPADALKDPKAFGEKPIGNGPYKMADGEAWVHNQSIKLVADKNYEGPNKAKNEGVEFKLYNDLNAAYTDLQAGNLDVPYESVPATALATYKKDFPKTNVSKPVAITQSVSIPLRAEHFGADEEGKLRRQAISMAINRDVIIDKIFLGSKTPAKDFGAPTLGDGTPDIKGNEVLNYDPAKAKELWKKADAIKPFTGTFEIAYNGDGGHKEWIEAVTNDISQNLGIKAEGKSYPTFKALRDDVTNKTIKTGFRTGWVGDYPAISNFLTPVYATGGSSNDTGFSNPRFDELLKKAAAATDKNQQQQFYDEAQAILMADLPAIPMWYGNVTSAWSEDLSNVQYDWKGSAVYPNIEKK